MDGFYFNMTYPPKKNHWKITPFLHTSSKTSTPGPYRNPFATKNPMLFGAEKLLLLVSNLAVLASWFKTPTCFEPPSSKSRQRKKHPGICFNQNSWVLGKKWGKIGCFHQFFVKEQFWNWKKTNLSLFKDPTRGNHTSYTPLKVRNSTWEWRVGETTYFHFEFRPIFFRSSVGFSQGIILRHQVSNMGSCMNRNAEWYF